MSNKKYCIYKHTSPSGKSYIGQTCDYQSRISQHKYSSKYKNFAFCNAIKKYGFDSFVSEILESNLSVEQANDLENRLIKEHNTLFPNGYNLRDGGNNKSFCNETRKKMSDSAKKRGISANAVLANISRLRSGYNPMNSEAARKKLSISTRGRKNSTIHNIKNGISHSKKVDQFTIDGEFVKTFNSQREAAKYLNCTGSLIGMCVSGKITTAKCFVFKRHNEAEAVDLCK